jgi:Kef-type K+ transport system membrane component KefB
VGELIGGIILGPTWLHLIDHTAQPFPVFASLGFAMLMLESGTEIDLGSAMPRQTAVRGSSHASLFIVLLAASSAAVALPTIREEGLSGPTFALVIAWIALADAVTALLMPLMLTSAGQIPAALLGDALIILAAALTIALGRRYFRTGLAREAERLSKDRHWALRLRVSVLMLLFLGAIAEHTGASLLVAGFAAGIVLRQFREPQRLALELTGLATGFFVPAFFVLLGASLDLKGLARLPSAIALAVGMALAATVVHLVAAIVVGTEQRLPAGLLASAQLGLPAAAALVAGGLLTLIPATTGAQLLARVATREPAVPT